jgi:hypothetical protein
MKQLFIFALISFFAFSCDFNDEPDPLNTAEQWKLAGYSIPFSKIPGIVTVQDSAFVYTLFATGEFTKTVGKNELTGTFEKGTLADRTTITFNFLTPKNLLIHSCFQGKEQYFIDGSGQMIGTWDSCDGTKLYFNKEN